jgi:Chaperone of endosialidase
MSWSGGTYTKGNAATGGWTGDASLGIGIEAGRHDTQDNDFATGINQCLNKDGSNSATGNLNLGGFIATNAASGTAAAPALCAGNDQDTGLFSPAANQIGIATNGTEKIRIDASGNVGLGTTTPGAVVDIHNASSLLILNTYRNDAAGSSVFFQKSRSATIGTNTIVQNGDAIGSVYFNGANGTGYSEAALIRGSVDGTPGATNDMPGRLQFYTTPDGSGTLTERMRITNGGFVFINTTSNFSADKMCLAFGTAENGFGIRDNNDTSGATFAVFRNSTNAICGSVTRVTTTNAVNYNTSSDYRLKVNVAPLVNGLQRALQLKPVSFDWIDNSESSEGFIAHEVAEVFPHAVSGTKDDIDENGRPKYQGVDYGKITPILAAAIKELNAKVEALEARVAELEA